MIDNWGSFLETVEAKLGAGTAGLLSSVVPSRFEDGLLTLEFPHSAQMQKQLCERNGRIEQIQGVLAEHLSRPVELRFEIAAGPPEPQGGQRKPRTSVQNRDELINDPAVKEVLMGLDATITDIEENREN